MNKKALFHAFFGVLGVTSTALANYSGSWTVSAGTTNLGFVLSNGGYYTEAQSASEVVTQTYASAYLNAYFDGKSRSVFSINPWNQGKTLWNKGANAYFEEYLTNSATFLGASQAEPAWSSCGQLCASSTNTINYDKEILSAEYNFTICYIPVSFTAKLKVSTGVSATSYGNNNPTTSNRTYQYGKSSIYPYAKLYTRATEGIGFSSLGAGLYENFNLFAGSLPNTTYSSVTVPLNSSVATRNGSSTESINIDFGSGEVGFYYNYVLGSGHKKIASWKGYADDVRTLWNSGVLTSKTTMW